MKTNQTLIMAELSNNEKTQAKQKMLTGFANRLV